MRFVLLLLATILAGCGEKASTEDDLRTIDATLPNGKVIKAETMIDPQDMARGMMFRPAMKPDHGMLFYHSEPAKNKYWMYQTLIPLDIIWMDSDHRIVEIVPNAPPCKTQASKCPLYGGNEVSKYVLELAGGMVQKNGLKLGQNIRF